MRLGANFLLAPFPFLVKVHVITRGIAVQVCPCFYSYQIKFTSVFLQVLLRNTSVKPPHNSAVHECACRVSPLYQGRKLGLGSPLAKFRTQVLMPAAPALSQASSPWFGQSIAFRTRINVQTESMEYRWSPAVRIDPYFVVVETPTFAGRSSRSCSKNPSAETSIISPAFVSATGASKIAS